MSATIFYTQISFKEETETNLFGEQAVVYGDALSQTALSHNQLSQVGKKERRMMPWLDAIEVE